eukprot:TRINITY_DN68132_c1_g1_i1.p1 TRINITY_DN68132_c1_g1~~TRINITY_DN68132_c1_g1_i1.p1  ORF type:complete len:625 (-),score=94.98 TRINITY_DN68132_c1_g1_i1:173-2047(-)
MNIPLPPGRGPPGTIPPQFRFPNPMGQPSVVLGPPPGTTGHAPITTATQRAPIDPKDVIHVLGNQTTANMENQLYQHIQETHFYKHTLTQLTSIPEVIEKAETMVEYINGWGEQAHQQKRGSHLVIASEGGTAHLAGMRGWMAQSHQPSPCWCLLYRLHQLKPNKNDCLSMLQNDNPYIRCMSLIYLRLVLDPKEFWEWFEESLDDEEELVISARPEKKAKVQEVAHQLLIQLKYLDTRFPRRSPVGMKQVRQNLERKGLSGGDDDVGLVKKEREQNKAAGGARGGRRDLDGPLPVRKGHLSGNNTTSSRDNTSTSDSTPFAVPSRPSSGGGDNNRTTNDRRSSGGGGGDDYSRRSSDDRGGGGGPYRDNRRDNTTSSSSRDDRDYRNGGGRYHHDDGGRDRDYRGGHRDDRDRRDYRSSRDDRGGDRDRDRDRDYHRDNRHRDDRSYNNRDRDSRDYRDRDHHSHRDSHRDRDERHSRSDDRDRRGDDRREGRDDHRVDSDKKRRKSLRADLDGDDLEAVKRQKGIEREKEQRRKEWERERQQRKKRHEYEDSLSSSSDDEHKDKKKKDNASATLQKLKALYGGGDSTTNYSATSLDAKQRMLAKHNSQATARVTLGTGSWGR